MGQYAVISFENSMRTVTAILYIIYIYVYIDLSIYAHLIITSKICYINFCIFISRFWKLSLKAMLLFILILSIIMTRCTYFFKHSLFVFIFIYVFLRVFLYVSFICNYIDY